MSLRNPNAPSKLTREVVEYVLEQQRVFDAKVKKEGEVERRIPDKFAFAVAGFGTESKLTREVVEYVPQDYRVEQKRVFDAKVKEEEKQIYAYLKCTNPIRTNRNRFIEIIMRVTNLRKKRIGDYLSNLIDEARVKKVRKLIGSWYFTQPAGPKRGYAIGSKTFCISRATYYAKKQGFKHFAAKELVALKRM